MFDFENSFPRRLQVALDDAVAEFNSSRDPDAAVAKTALDHGFHPEGAKRLTETFNRARTIFHFSTAEDKTAEFRLADPEKVAQLMYSPAEPVKEAAVQDIIALQAMYDAPETDYVKAASAEDMEKFAEFIDVATPVCSERNIRGRIETQRSWFKKAAYTAEVARDTALMYADQVMDKLAHDMTLSAKDSADLKARFALLKEACRRDVELQPVAAELPSHFETAYGIRELPVIKFASVLDTTAVDRELEAVRTATQYLKTAANASAMLETFQKDANEFEAQIQALLQPELTKAADPEDDFLVKRAAPPQAGAQGQAPAAPKDKAKPEASASKAPVLDMGISKAIGRQADRSFGNFFDTDMFRVTTGAPLERENKAISGNIANLHRQLLLEDLLQNDPVLSAADPNAVVSAYQALLNMAPTVASQKPTVVAILRSAIHAPDAYSPYDAEQLLRLDSALRNVTGASARAPQGAPR